MAGKILKSILTVAIAVLFACLLVITGFLYQDFALIQHLQLKDELQFAATATEQLGAAYLDKLSSDRYRLTWVTADGTVLYDSRADSQTMENHANREEILQALHSGTGSSSRYSDTLTEKTIYQAVRLEDGSVLRISISSDTAAAWILELLQPILIIALLAIGLSAWLAHRMAKQVVEPLNRINLDEPMTNNTYEELLPLLQRIHSQHQEIEFQMQLLKQKQQEFDQITGHMKEALVLLDANRRIVSINPAAAQLFHTAPSCEGKLFYSKKYDPDMTHAIAEAEVQGHSEVKISANERTYLFNISRIESDSMIYGIVILAFDVTERENAEQIRRNFTSNVSHELKTPLQSIIGSAELIENGIVKIEDLPRFVGHIRKEASRLVKLIEDIIRLAQLDEGIIVSTDEVSLFSIAKEVQEALLHAAEEKNVTLSVAGDHSRIQGVHSLLYELIYNLVDNAIRYNKNGGSVQVSITDEANHVHLCVADTGIGIPPEHHSQIFERFYRVDKSHSKKSGGTGLGLSIVKHAVKYHHGTIHIDSTLDVGTSISITLKK